MKREFFAFLVIAVFFDIAGPAAAEDKNQESIKFDVTYRQGEFQSQWRYLNDREKKAAEELNEEIGRYNLQPSAVTLQRAEDLKVRIIETLQDQIKNDVSYIAYLEKRLSDLLGHEVKSFGAVTEYTGEIKNPAEGFAEDIDLLRFKKDDIAETEKVLAETRKEEEPFTPALETLEEPLNPESETAGKTAGIEKPPEETTSFCE